MRYQQSLLIAAFSACLLPSCKKDKESDAPVITITAPVDGFALSIPGSFTINATISDDQGPIDAKAMLVSSNGVPIGEPLYFGDSGTTAQVNLQYALTSESILSGAYTLRLSASDGENETFAYRTINITGAPLRFRALFAPEANGTVHKVDSVLGLSVFGSYGQEVNDAAISSKQGLLYLGGGNTGPVTAIDVNTASVRWSLANNNTQGTPFFTYLTASDAMDRILIGRNNGSFATYNSAYGGGLTTFSAQPNHLPSTGLITDQYVLCEQRHETLPNALITVHTLWADDLIATAPLDIEAVVMYQRSSSHMLVFGNRGGDGVILDRNMLQGGGFEPRTFSQNAMRAALKLDNNKYVLALADGIYGYTYNPDQVTLISNLTAERLAYDPVSGALFATTGNVLHVLDAASGFETATISLPATPVDLLVLLNR